MNTIQLANIWKQLNPPKGQTAIKIAVNTYLEVVDDFKYLGAYIANSNTDFKRRKGLAWSQFWKRTTVWKSNEISLSVKLHLFNSLILSILFYNPEAWVTKKVMEKEIDSFGYMLGIRRIDRVRNGEVLQRVQRSNLSSLMYKRQLRSLGRWIRKDNIIRRFALYTNCMEEIHEESQSWTTTNTFKISLD